VCNEGAEGLLSVGFCVPSLLVCAPIYTSSQSRAIYYEKVVFIVLLGCCEMKGMWYGVSGNRG
jgi:hypothetical protein